MTDTTEQPISFTEFVERIAADDGRPAPDTDVVVFLGGTTIEGALRVPAVYDGWVGVIDPHLRGITVNLAAAAVVAWAETRPSRS